MKEKMDLVILFFFENTRGAYMEQFSHKLHHACIQPFFSFISRKNEDLKKENYSFS